MRATAKPNIDPALVRLVLKYRNDWNAFARNCLGVKLDPKQDEVLHSMQVNRRTVVKSGHGRGKDYTAACGSICHLLTRYPSKVINTGPTDRQVKGIMMTEIRSIWKNSKVPLGGRLGDATIKFDFADNWFLIGFKAADKATEAWTGFHSPYPMVVVTEASGVAQETFHAIEGLLTGDSRLVLIMNPNKTSGEGYQAFKSPLYTKFTLSCLDAPNVKAKRTIIPGQVDWEWIDGLIKKPGWVTEIPKTLATAEEGDFEWEGRWYRPGDLFRPKVLGMWPREPEGQLIPLAWVEAAQERWKEWEASGSPISGPLRLGVDVAGMGSDNTLFCWRYGNVVARTAPQPRQDHMATAGAIKTAVESELHVRPHEGTAAYIDTIGEGAGVYSRTTEEGVPSYSVKFSEGAKGLNDMTDERTFANMRAYCYWAIRDALDPEFGINLALPPVDELTQDLTAPQWKPRSNGDILIEDKDEIKKRLGRSPDWGDALANTFYPGTNAGNITSGTFSGLGVF